VTSIETKRDEASQYQKGCGPRKTMFGLGTFLDWLRPRPEYWTVIPEGVKVHMGRRPKHRGPLACLLGHERKYHKAGDFVIWNPMVALFTTSLFSWRGLWDRAKWSAHHGWQSFLGFWGNVLGLGVFAFIYYVGTQNGLVVHQWNSPPFLGQSVVALGIWAFLRKVVVRDTGEVVLRAVFAWLAFTNPVSRSRQLNEFNFIIRGFGHSWAVPSPAEPERSLLFKKWDKPLDITRLRNTVQTLLSWFTVMFAAQPGIWLFLGPLLIWGIFDHSVYAWTFTHAYKYAGPLGALIVGRIVYNELSIRFQEVIVDLFNDHGWTMHSWMGIPVTVCAYQASGIEQSREGWMQKFRIPLILTVIVVSVIMSLIGYWILHNKMGYLQNHYVIFNGKGTLYMLHHWRSAL
jgi:hypothetical protein